MESTIFQTPANAARHIGRTDYLNTVTGEPLIQAEEVRNNMIEKMSHLKIM
jgi:hypothetical protein